MKLLLLISNLGSGGAERQLVTLAVLFKEKGFDVEFIVYQKKDFYKHILDEHYINIIRITPKNNIDRILKIRKLIRHSDCDAVISFLEVNNFLASLAAIGGKKWKLITTELSAKSSTFTSNRGRFFSWFQRYSDAIVCNSYNAKAMWEKHYPHHKHKLSVIYNPVIIPKITSNYIPRRNGKIWIVVAASYRYLKNPIGLIKALNLLNTDEREKIVVDWYGNQSFDNNKTNVYEEAINLVNNYNLNNVINLNGPTKSIADIMNQADVVALFSKLEGLPNAICEGMMIGKPIIMSKVSDYKSLVDESNGFLCDWDNPESIKNVLQKAINLKSEQLIEMGLHSKNKAKKYFSSMSIVNQWINTIRP